MVILDGFERQALLFPDNEPINRVNVDRENRADLSIAPRLVRFTAEA